MKRYVSRVVTGGLLLLFCSGVAMAATPALWESRGVGAGGATFSPSISPFNPGEIYLSCDMSDLFHTTNSGAAWTTVDFNQIEAFHSTEVQFTSDPQVLYALDYHQLVNPSSSVQLPSRSLDGGNTWTRFTGSSWTQLTFCVLADPHRTDRLVVAGSNDVYFSGDGGTNFAFVTVATNNRVAGAFFDGTNVFIACQNGLMYSSDGGTNFTVATVGGIPTNTAFYSFTGAKQGGVIRFYCVQMLVQFAKPDATPAVSPSNCIYVLDWGDPNWTALTNGITTNDVPVMVAMARTNISTAYVAFNKRNAQYPDNNEVLKTTNRGTNWQSVFTVATNFNLETGWGGVIPVTSVNHAIPQAFTVDPNDANHVIKADSGLIHMTTNGGTTWQAIYVPVADRNPTNTIISQSKAYHSVGLEPTVCYWVTWNSPTNMFTAFSDIRMIRSQDGGSTWSFNYSGFFYDDIHQVIQHPSTNALYAITTLLMSPYQLMGIGDASLDASPGYLVVSTNSGLTWTGMTNLGVTPTWIAIDPTNANTMYVSTAHSSSGAIWRTQNLLNGTNANWVKLSAHARTRGHPYNIRILNDGTLACTYAAGVTTSNRFTSSSGVFICTNVEAAAAGDTNAWVDRSSTSMVYWTQDLVIDPFDAGQSNWFAGVWNGFGLATNGYPNPFLQGGMYASTDRGVNWTKIFTNGEVTSCTFNPCNSNEVYVCSRLSGLWCTTNIHAVMPTFLPVTNFPHRQPQRVFFNPYNSNEVWITSNGNGLRVGTLTPGSLQFSAPALNVNESGTNAVVTVTRSGGHDNPVAVSFLTGNNTATAGVDYASTSGVLNWPDGDASSRTIVIPVIDDHLASANKMFSASLVNAFHATLGVITNASITILESPYDAWKFAHFGTNANTTGIAGDTDDPDGDGLGNYTEFLAGTDPTNKASAFAIIGLASQGNDMVVTWKTAGPRTNIVQSAGVLTNNSFADTGTPIAITVTGDAVTNFLDIGGATNAVHFWRVRLVP